VGHGKHGNREREHIGYEGSDRLKGKSHSDRGRTPGHGDKGEVIIIVSLNNKRISIAP